MIASEEPATPPPAMRTSATGFSSGLQSFRDWGFGYSRRQLGLEPISMLTEAERDSSQPSKMGVTSIFAQALANRHSAVGIHGGVALFDMLEMPCLSMTML